MKTLRQLDTPEGPLFEDLAEQRRERGICDNKDLEAASALLLKTFQCPSDQVGRQAHLVRLCRELDSALNLAQGVTLQSIERSLGRRRGVERELPEQLAIAQAASTVQELCAQEEGVFSRRALDGRIAETLCLEAWDVTQIIKQAQQECAASIAASPGAPSTPLNVPLARLLYAACGAQQLRQGLWEECARGESDAVGLPAAGPDALELAASKYDPWRGR